MRTIGIVGPDYGLERVSYALPVEGYRFDFFHRLPLHCLERSGTFFDNTPIVLGCPPLLHTFNMLPINARRFVVSVECEIPRYLEQPPHWQMNIGRRLLTSKRCVQILALSEAAHRHINRSLLEQGIPETLSKLSIFRGGVQLSQEPSRIEKPSHGPIRLIFVGDDAFRKGLVPLVRAIEELRRGGIELMLTVISAVHPLTYALGQFTPSREEWVEKLNSLPWIRYHQHLPNKEVRQMMSEHDLLVLPTLDESLGWVFIEAGMEGLGSIGTDIFAIPELIENGTTGQAISIDVNSDRRWVGLFIKGDEKRIAIDQAENRIKKGLLECLHRISLNRELIRLWGQRAKEKMLRMYHPMNAAEQLKNIYDRALQT